MFISSRDPYTQLKYGTEGTVLRVREDSAVGTVVSVQWDDGSTLRMLSDQGDNFRVYWA